MEYTKHTTGTKTTILEILLKTESLYSVGSLIEVRLTLKDVLDNVQERQHRLYSIQELHIF
jgi:hypothetical protein